MGRYNDLVRRPVAAAVCQDMATSPIVHTHHIYFCLLTPAYSPVSDSILDNGDVEYTCILLPL